MPVHPSQFTESGLYLLFPDGTSLALTHGTIEARSAAILSNPEKIPPKVKASAAFDQSPSFQGAGAEVKP
jgi:hypothetical protein